MKASDAADHGRIVGKVAVAVDLAPVRENLFYVVEEIGTLRMAGEFGLDPCFSVRDFFAQRLNALYQDQGRMTIEVRQAGGTRVTILLPRESGAAA